MPALCDITFRVLDPQEGHQRSTQRNHLWFFWDSVFVCLSLWVGVGGAVVAWSSLVGQTVWQRASWLPLSLPLPILALKVCATHLVFLCGCWAFKLRSLYLCNTHFADWATSPALWKSSLKMPRWRTRDTANCHVGLLHAVTISEFILQLSCCVQETLSCSYSPFLAFSFFSCSFFLKDPLSLGENNMTFRSQVEPSTSSLLLCMLTIWGGLCTNPHLL